MGGPEAKQWNPRYVAYAAKDGLTPEEALARDLDLRPGGCMVDFILWVGDRVRAFRKAHPEAFVGEHLQDQAAFDRFLGVI